MGNWLFLILVLSLVFPPSYQIPVPTGNEDEQQGSDEVKELESLRTENNKSNSTVSEPSGVLQDASGLQPTALSITDDGGERPSNSRSAIFRHRGITQAKKSRYWNEKVQQQPNGDGYNKFAGIQYSPTDLAAYVFNTGDEEGVAVAVEELVREGMMGRTDAINYLQDVKQILTYMRDQYEQRKKIEEFRNRAFPKPQVTQRFPSPPREQYIAELDTEKRDLKPVEVAPAPVGTTEHPHQAVIASTSEPKEPPQVASTTAHPKTEDTHDESYKDDDLKRHVPPRNTYGFTLEIIYKLAKDMFTQSILRDDPTAEETLSGLVTFLESEVGNKRISPAMKEKVLETVSAALVDSLRDYQAMMAEEAGLYQHLAEANRPLMAKVPMSELYHKLGVKDHENILQLTSNSNRPKSS